MDKFNQLYEEITIYLHVLHSKLQDQGERQDEIIQLLVMYKTVMYLLHLLCKKAYDVPVQYRLETLIDDVEIPGGYQQLKGSEAMEALKERTIEWKSELEKDMPGNKVLTIAIQFMPVLQKQYEQIKKAIKDLALSQSSPGAGQPADPVEGLKLYPTTTQTWFGVTREKFQQTSNEDVIKHIKAAMEQNVTLPPPLLDIIQNTRLNLSDKVIAIKSWLFNFAPNGVEIR
tara:strand:- start:760 stop:1446 length:687 start_codon:yes stop_codon:yes gene_type:complete